MKLFCITIILGAWQCPLPAMAEDQAVLQHVQCDVCTGFSRVEMHLAGALRYAVDHHDQAIVVHFVSAQAALSAGAANIEVRNSVVKRVLVETAPHNVVNVRTVLRGPAQYRIVEPDQGGVLYVDVYGDMPSARPSSARTQELQKEKKQSLAEKRGTPLVDIAAIARSQVTTPAVGQAERKTTEPLPSATPFDGNPGLQKLIGVPFLITMITAAAVLVVGLVYVRIKRLERRKDERPALTATVGLTSGQPPAEDHQPSDVVPNAGADPAEDQESLAGSDADLLLFAERFQRSQGEFHLTYTMEKQKTPRNSVSNLLHSTCSTQTKSQRVKMAKRLGVGQGEVALAASLKGLQGKHGRGNHTIEQESV